jgi:hypothetical protein
MRPAAAVLALAGAAQAGIVDLRLTTDRGVDCSSIQSIARDLYRDCKTDEEKAIATWYFVRRLHFHWPHIPTWDSIDLINSYGFALCGYQSTMFAQICTAGGLKARTMHPPKHVIAEAFYDNAWHMYDCQVGWFAYRRDKSAVASCDEMKADPTIVSEAVKDGRASQPFFQCRDNPGSGVNYAAGARTGITPSVPDKRLILNLRRGESIARVWGNEGKSWRQDGETKWVEPIHGCLYQSVDVNDPVNWPYWKPYAQIESRLEERVIYGVKRTYGNGRMLYEPNLATDAFLDGVVKDETAGVKAAWQEKSGANLRPAEPGKPGAIVFVIDTPYVGVDAWIDAEGLRKNDGDVLAVSARAEKGKWQKVWTADKTGSARIENVSLKPMAWFGHRYYVRFEMQAAAKTSDVGFDRFKVTTVFMNNIYALPQLLPGRNTIRVATGGISDLKANALTIDYAWEEQGEAKALSRRIDTLPFEITVDVAGNDLPRMKHVTLSVAP